jgi:transcriptional regulator with XRE-family HTH domain
VSEARIRTLQRAAVLAGGEQALARQLKVSRRTLAGWLSGEQAAPTYAFLHCADLVSEYTLSLLGRIPPGSDEPRRPAGSEPRD